MDTPISAGAKRLVTGKSDSYYKYLRRRSPTCTSRALWGALWRTVLSPITKASNFVVEIDPLAAYKY